VILHIGKPILLKKIMDGVNHLNESTLVFSKTTANRVEIISAGEQIIVSLYGGNIGDTLDL